MSRKCSIMLDVIITTFSLALCISLEVWVQRGAIWDCILLEMLSSLPWLLRHNIFLYFFIPLGHSSLFLVELDSTGWALNVVSPLGSILGPTHLPTHFCFCDLNLPKILMTLSILMATAAAQISQTSVIWTSMYQCPRSTLYAVCLSFYPSTIQFASSSL